MAWKEIEDRKVREKGGKKVREGCNYVQSE